jgi:hypothetical protein
VDIFNRFIPASFSIRQISDVQRFPFATTFEGEASQPTDESRKTG